MDVFETLHDTHKPIKAIKATVTLYLIYCTVHMILVHTVDTDTITFLLEKKKMISIVIVFLFLSTIIIQNVLYCMMNFFKRVPFIE